MSYRVSGAIRLLLGVPLYILMLLISWPLAIGAVLFWLLDSGYQVVTNRDGITSQNALATVYQWYLGLFKYVVFGDKNTQGGRTARKWTRQ